MGDNHLEMIFVYNFYGYKAMEVLWQIILHVNHVATRFRRHTG